MSGMEEFNNSSIGERYLEKAAPALKTNGWYSCSEGDERCMNFAGQATCAILKKIMG